MESNTSENKITLTVPCHHRWIKGVRGISSVMEYLLDEKFGVDWSNNAEEYQLMDAKKIAEAQKIIEIMRIKRKEEKAEAAIMIRSRNFKKLDNDDL